MDTFKVILLLSYKTFAHDFKNVFFDVEITISTIVPALRMFMQQQLDISLGGFPIEIETQIS